MDAVKGEAAELGYDVAWHQSDATRIAAQAEAANILSAPLTSESVVRAALLNNPSLQTSLADVGIYVARADQAGRMKNPLFDAGLRAPTAGGSVNLDFGVVFEFLDLLRLPGRQRAAMADLSMIRSRAMQDILTLAGRTRAAFLKLQACREVVELHKDRSINARAARDLAQTLWDAGNVTEAVVLAYRQRHRVLEFSFSESVSACILHRARLVELIGVTPTDYSWRINDPIPSYQAADRSNALTEIAVETSFLLAAARAEIEALAERTGVPLRDQGFEEIEIGVAGERDDGEWEVGPSLAIPLPLFDDGSARQAEARAQLIQAEDRYRALVAQVRMTAGLTIHRLWRTDAKATHIADRSLSLAQAAAEDATLQYNAMQIGLFDLLVAREAVLSLKIDAANAKLEQGLARNDADLIRVGGMPVSKGEPLARDETGPSMVKVDH